MVTATTKKYCVPGKPQITNNETNIDSTFTLTWLKPTYDGGDNIIKYKVEWRRRPITNTTVADEKDNIGDTQLKVEGLEAGQTYEFKVYASNRAEGISEPDTMSFTVKTGGTKPYVIKKAPDVVYSFIGNSDPTFVTCTFGGYPEPWVVMKYDKKLVSNATTTANFSIITDAKDNFGTYHCRAQNEYGHQNQTIELKEVEKPSEVLNFRADRFTCDSVTLTWASPLKDGGMPINKFVLEYDDNTRSIESWKRSHTIFYLKRDEDYTFAIRATNKGARGDKTNTKVKTKKYCVPGRPIICEPSSSALDETSFTLKWHRPENTGGDDEIEYIIRYREVSEDKEMPWKKFTTKETEYDIEDLDRQKRYKFEVTAKNKGGESSPDERYFTISKVGARSFQLQLGASFMVIFTAGILHLL